MLWYMKTLCNKYVYIIIKIALLYGKTCKILKGSPALTYINSSVTNRYLI